MRAMPWSSLLTQMLPNTAPTYVYCKGRPLKVDSESDIKLFTMIKKIRNLYTFHNMYCFL